MQENDIQFRLQILQNRTQYPIKQENGQRIFGPPLSWKSGAPPRGCEIFVCRLPRDACEDELFPMFSEIGPVYQIRLMMDFSGFNRGFCFVEYGDHESAKLAVQTLHRYEVSVKFYKQ